ncbi:hypothetical protein [Janibacter massiliensis]|uniref:hypothetical protein n=1 Tax=Janibacter massiliensis TaxID=2058291 RepID=UPI000D0E74A1|nr:hypothetical protein [Janibacter massiliensis]
MPTRPVLVLGDQPQPLVLRVTRGEPATLAAALRDTDQQPRPWAPPVSLVLDDTAGTRIDATLEDDLATWNLTADQAAAAVAAERVRIEEAGTTVAAGFVADSDAFHAGHRGNAIQVERVRRGSPGKEPPPTDITIGEVATLPTGVGASASVRGVAPNLILDLRLPKGAKGDPWDAQAQAQAQGFWMVVSDTPPTETTMYGVPVVWVPEVEPLQDVPVIPREPAWQISAGTFSVPSFVGVDYMYDGRVVTGTVTVPSTRPLDVTVTAVAQPGYYLTSPYSWTKNYPDPNAYLLQSSDDFTGLAAGEQFITAPAGAVAGWNTARAWDNALGGASQINWRYSTSMNPDLTLTKATAGGAIEFVGKGAWVGQQRAFQTMDQSQVIDFDVDALPFGSGTSSWTVTLGGVISGNAITGGASVKVTMGATPQITLSATGLTTSPAYNYAGPAKGRWRFEWTGDTLSVTAPSGQNHAYSTVGITGTRGRMVGVAVSLSNYATASHAWRVNSIMAGSRAVQP